MSLLKPFRSVVPVANNDTATYYVSMQPVTCGPTSAKFVSANLTFQPSTQTLSVNKSPVVYSNTRSVFNLTTSSTPPSSPKIGDLWYDTSTDIQFEYVNDGTNLQWVDITSPLIPGEVKYVYQAVTANQNTNIVYALADSVNNYSNIVTFSVKTINLTDGTVVYWKDLGTANNNPTSLQNRFLSSNTGNVTILNNSSEITRIAIADQAVYSASNTYLQLGFYACASFNRLLSTTDIVPVVDNSSYAPGFLTANLQYIVVGGGGGGGYQGGGGGGGVAVGNVIVSNTTFGSSLNVIVGGGGAGVVDNVLGPGQNGSNSTIGGIYLTLENGTLAPTTTVTAIGGGGGHLAGGSGGGTPGTAPPLSPGTQPSQNPGILYVTNYGNPGGANPTKGGGGGGGANTSAPLGSGQGQNGGSGYRWQFTANTYAGGGGGGAPTFQGFVGTGGVGGGGAGTTAFNPPSGNPGVANTGGGGGGAGQCNCGRPINSGTGGAGGPGTVIFAYQANGTYYTGGTIRRSPALSPGYTIHTFTSPGLLTYNGFTTLSPVPVSFLVVGGGGAGGTGSVGNGAGGGGGGGGIVCGTLIIDPGITYSISVGTGGWQGTVTSPQPNAVGRSGNNSTITGTGTIITALGGGGGSTQGTDGPIAGGSGGGGRGFLTAGTPNPGMAAAQPAQSQTLPAGSTSTNRGFSGGTGFGPRAGGGGGGAGGTGFAANPAGLAPGGPGGIGYTWPLNATIYGGGGGGGSDNAAGTGGPGGGGAGTFVPGPGTATAGTNGLGGGGGGSGQVPLTAAFGGAGGHGVVILAVPNVASPSFIGTGATVSNPPAAPGQTVFTYAAPTPGSTPGTFTFSL